MQKKKRQGGGGFDVNFKQEKSCPTAKGERNKIK